MKWNLKLACKISCFMSRPIITDSARSAVPPPGGGGGTQIIVGRGCVAETSEPIPTSKGPFAEIGYPCLRIFCQKWTHV